MDEQLSCNVSIHEEEQDGKRVFVVDCVKLGISDFGDSVEEAFENLKKGIHLLLEECPEKKELLKKQEPVMISRLFL